MRSSTRWFFAVISARQPSSTTMVWCGSMTIAGPGTLWPALSRSRVNTSASCQAPLEKKRVSRAGEGRGASVVDTTGSANVAPPPMASTDTASTTSCFASSMKPKRALCAASNADFIAARAGAASSFETALRASSG